MAHEVEDGAEKFASGVGLTSLGAIGGMKRGFGRRKREDQSTATDVDGMETENVAEESAIGFGMISANEDVSANKHGGGPVVDHAWENLAENLFSRTISLGAGDGGMLTADIVRCQE